MNILAELRSRLRTALPAFLGNDTTVNLDELALMVRPAQEAKFGDYQVNCAMSLGKTLGRAPRDVAQDLLKHLKTDDLFQPPEVAGPGFINLKLHDEWLAAAVATAASDERQGIAPAAKPRTYVLDYSAPNVAKEMHVGHIRSTVIGNALYRTLKFLGHTVIGDNHLGDWGTQFGMIIYGYKHFRDEAAYKAKPVAELGRLYKLVRATMDYLEARPKLQEIEVKRVIRQQQLEKLQAEPPLADKNAAKKAQKSREQLLKQMQELADEVDGLRQKIAKFESEKANVERAAKHAGIHAAVLAETAKLHADDPENLRLWKEFLPHCRADIQRIYDRLDVRFDYEYGESFYHDRLATVVNDLEKKGLARESDGALCVFLDGFEAPMIVRKRDGAYLYATTDLATIQFRQETWQPDAILYVVDHRQSDHFAMLFAAAKKWGYDKIEFQHVKFGTVLGDDSKPFKTRAGDTVGLDGLLDEAISRSLKLVSELYERAPTGKELGDEERRQISQTVGIGALKYADLSQNRTSDYTFSYDKMTALEGNTAPYMQYAYARVKSIFRKGDVDPSQLAAGQGSIQISHPAEKALALALIRFGEALELVATEYMPNHLTAYLYDLAFRFSAFFESCPVLKAETPELKRSRLLLCHLTAQTIKQGLALLGIGVVEKM